MYECLEPLLFLHFCDELVGFCHGFGNVVADMVVADEPVYIRLFESGVYRGIDPRQNDMYLLFLRRGNQDFEVVDSRRIDKRYFSLRIMRTSGRSAILRISSSNLVATPKKNGPSIS